MSERITIKVWANHAGKLCASFQIQGRPTVEKVLDSAILVQLLKTVATAEPGKVKITLL